MNCYHDQSLSQNRVDVYYNEKDSEVSALLTFLEETQKLIGRKDGIEKRLLLQEIYYFEAVEKKCFAYLEKQVYQVEGNLQTLEEQYGNLGFVRINKSMVLNILKINELKACVNMKTQAIRKWRSSSH